jgi:hypothetical protein
MPRIHKTTERNVPKFSTLNSSQTFASVQACLHYNKSNNSYHMFGEIFIIEIFMEPSYAQLSATVCETATQHRLQHYYK